MRTYKRWQNSGKKEHGMSSRLINAFLKKLLSILNIMFTMKAVKGIGTNHTGSSLSGVLGRFLGIYKTVI